VKRALLACALVLGCQRVPDDSPPAISNEAHGGEIRFSFGTTQGEEVSSARMHGRVTVLVFVTTFDLGSQVVARRVEQLLHAHHPRFNAAAVVLEAAKYAPLADVFRSTLELTYPVAIADLALLQQSSNIGDVNSVPIVLVLDKNGLEVARVPGTPTLAEIEALVRHAEQ